MAVRVTCPNPECGAVASVEEQSLGRRGRCRKCGHVFALTRPGGEPASAITGDASAWKGSTPARPAAGPADLPEQFGRYRIMKLLGQGGMGAVYLAHDIKLDRRVALKVPFLHPGEGPQAIQRFEREARLAATLDHPNLCRILDVGEVDGTPYLTMPYIEGKPLSEAIPRGQVIPEAQAAAVTRKLALALAEAHARGIIHRDLKPGNIMVNRRRELIIMDFGLARAMDGDDRPITRTGHVLGTALYMAPEQAAGDLAATGPTADVYSLGVILYELLTGFRPFEGPWSLVIGLKNVKDPDPPTKHRPGLDHALDAICVKAIAKAPGDRYPSMAEFAEALGDYLDSPPAEIDFPDEDQEMLAAQVFAGLVSREVTLNRGDKPLATPKPERNDGRWPRLPARVWIGIASAAILLLGSIIYVITDNGRIKIVVNDPKAVVKIDGNVISIEGLGEPITLRTGEHDFTVIWNNGETKTDQFIIKRRINENLIVRFEPKVKTVDTPSEVMAPPAQTGGEVAKLPKPSQAQEPVTPSGKLSNTPQSRIPSDNAADFLIPLNNRKAEVFRGTGLWAIDGLDLVLNGGEGEQGLLFGEASWSSYNFSFEALYQEGCSGIRTYYHLADQFSGMFFTFGINLGRRGFGPNTSLIEKLGSGAHRIMSTRAKTEMVKTAEPKMQANKWYKIKIEVRGTITKTYCDENQIFEFDANPFDHGRIGIGAWYAKPCKLRFRNIEVVAEDGSTLWKGLPEPWK